MKRFTLFLLTVLIAAWLVITVTTGPVSVFVWTSVGDLAWIAVLEALLIALTVTLHNIDLQAKIDRRYGRFSGAALLLVLFVAGCATSMAPAPTAATPKDDYGLPCVTSTWLYAWIDECGEGPTVRITWAEYYALRLADKVAAMREP